MYFKVMFFIFDILKYCSKTNELISHYITYCVSFDRYSILHEHFCIIRGYEKLSEIWKEDANLRCDDEHDDENAFFTFPPPVIMNWF